MKQNLIDFQNEGSFSLKPEQTIGENLYFSKDQFNDLINEIDKISLDYEKFFINKDLSYKNYNFFNYYDLHENTDFIVDDIESPYVKRYNNFIIHGSPLSYRISRSRGPAEIPSKDQMNTLYGYRSVLRECFFSKFLVNNIIENKNILKCISEIYDIETDEIEFINGSLASSYPGNTGEEGFFHIDTPGFTKNSFNENEYAINVMIYLSDVDETLAPMRVIPSSHKHYSRINSEIAKKYNNDPSVNNIPQSLTLWEELLPQGLKKEKKLLGKAGTITFMNSSLLHSATTNFSKNKTRNVIILNYSNKKNNFKKNNDYSHKSLTNFKNKFIDDLLIKNSFSTKQKINRRINYRQNPIRILTKISKKVNLKSKITKLYDYKIRKPFLNFILSEKKYLNLGASTGWSEPGFISLDYYNTNADIEIDLNKKSEIPIKSNSINGVYTSHCIEHLKHSVNLHWFKETYRILKKNGTFRLTAPDMELVFNMYFKKNILFFNWVKSNHLHNFDSWIRWITRMAAEPVVDNYTDQKLRKLLNEKSFDEYLDFFTNEVEKIEKNNYLSPNIHKTWWSGKKLIKILKEVGFSNVEIVKRRQSREKIFRRKCLNNTRPEMSFFVEATK